MEQAFYETALQIAATLFITLIGVLGAWLTAQIGRSTHLTNIGNATQQVIQAAQITVGELQQTIVDKAKENGAKLTEEQIASLGRVLLTLTRQKLSTPTINLLAAASVDINALITGAGENWINSIK